MEQRGRQNAQRSRSWSATAPATLPNEQALAALPGIQHVLDANRLTWPDVGLHPDCQFVSLSLYIYKYTYMYMYIYIIYILHTHTQTHTHTSTHILQDVLNRLSA
jgi:hypothetical protein